jgi:hypothetical protein
VVFNRLLKKEREWEEKKERKKKEVLDRQWNKTISGKSRF